MSRESFLKKALDKSGCLYYNIYLCAAREINNAKRSGKENLKKFKKTLDKTQCLMYNTKLCAA